MAISKMIRTISSKKTVPKVISSSACPFSFRSGRTAQPRLRRANTFKSLLLSPNSRNLLFFADTITIAHSTEVDNSQLVLMSPCVD